MIGEKIAELKGKTTSNRVLPGSNGMHILESSYAGTGKLAGIEVRDMGTYTGTFRPDGTLFGEGKGIYLGKGGEMANWTGQGVGLVQKDGSVNWRGTFIISSQSEAWRRLNQCACAFEFHVDAEGHHSGSMWEWK